MKGTALIGALFVLCCGTTAQAGGLFRGTLASAEPLAAGEGHLAAAWLSLDPNDPESYWVTHGRVGVRDRLALSGFVAAAENDSETDFWCLGAQIPFGDPEGVAAALFGSVLGGGDDLGRYGGGAAAFFGDALSKRAGAFSLDGALPLYVRRLTAPDDDCESALCELRGVPAPISLVASELWVGYYLSDRHIIRTSAFYPFGTLQYELRHGPTSLRCGVGLNLNGMVAVGVRF